MSSNGERLRVLLAGESWITWSLHVKGANIFTGASYGEGSSPLKKAFEDNDIEFIHIPGHLVTTEFPFTPEELADYDVVMISDIGSDSFLLHPDTFVHSKTTPNRLKSIEEYVRAGGGFCMIGGYMSFAGIEGRARYGETPIEDILPVSIRGWDDRVEAPEGVVPEPVSTEHPILKGIHGQWPHLLGYNRVVPKDSGKVLAKCGNDPLLVIGEYGKGRTAAFATDCSPHWATPEFVAWDAYPKLWTQLAAWLAGNI
ncbi:MAG: glutamine amidotransferase [Firmicutes bacterium]|jgi:uncharacterized membrane protein|nr:glutamine amidotransferase [Bacillota bacterium]MDD4793415.1 glutamine amidotransferase [Bacillota bacterium]